MMSAYQTRTTGGSTGTAGGGSGSGGVGSRPGGGGFRGGGNNNNNNNGGGNRGSSNVNNLARNRTLHETYKSELRQNMEKPIVTNKGLQTFINRLYRPDAKVGSGSTAEAIRHELASDSAVGGKYHIQKGKDALNHLGRWLKRNPTAPPGDRAIVENIINDLNDALGYTNRWYPQNK